MVLLGYSQGAQVTADFLCGRSEAGFGPTPAYATQVVADREFLLSRSLIQKKKGREKNQDKKTKQKRKDVSGVLEGLIEFITEKVDEE